MIRAYLTGRSQCVCIDGVASDGAHMSYHIWGTAGFSPGTFAILFIYELHIGGDADDVQLYISYLFIKNPKFL
jgi:hypothetical protein